jgi:hypothetical protein
MAAHGMDSGLVRLMVHMVLVYENLSKKVGGNSLRTLDIRWGMAPRLNCGIMCRVGSIPLR